MKNFIKLLAAEQHGLKKARKTGPYNSNDFKRNYWGDVDHASVPEKIKDAWSSAEKVQLNKARITAALNVYHELRGSDYRHNVKDGFNYNKYYNEIKKQFETGVSEGSV